MSDETRVEQLLNEVLDSNRSPEEVCADCPELLPEVRKRVEQMRLTHAELDALFPIAPHDRAHVEASGILDRPAVEQRVTTDYHPAMEVGGARIGPYKLLQQIGEGGFGVVYMAEQTEPVRRKVAVKIIKPGMDTKE